MCSYLVVAAEVYRTEMRGGWTDNIDLFDYPVKTWSFEYEEISTARQEFGALMSGRSGLGRG